MPEERPRALIAGGGFGGLEAALYLRERLPQADVVLVSDRPEFVFKPYLNYVPFGLQPEALQIDLAELADARGFHFRPGVAHDADPGARTVAVNGERCSYDALFVATGATAGPAPVPGLREHAYALGHAGEMRRLRTALHTLRDAARRGEQQRVAFFVPPGCAWAGPLYEMAFMCATWLDWKDARDETELLLLTAERRFMEAFSPNVHKTIQDELRRRDIGARRWQRPERAEASALVFPEEGRLPFDLLVTAPTAVASARWDALPTEADGFVEAEQSTRRVEGCPGVYAVGDASDYPVKQGFLALLQADAAAEHWAAGLLGEEPTLSFAPQATWLVEQFDQALFAQESLSDDPFGGGDPAWVKRLPAGQLRRILASEHLPARDASTGVNPLYAGLLWKGTETSLKMFRHLADQD